MPVLLSGRVQDYIRSAVRRYGSLIFVLAHATCGIPNIVAMRPEFVMSSHLLEFAEETQQKLLQAWLRVDDEIPLVTDNCETVYMLCHTPEIPSAVDDLYILG